MHSDRIKEQEKQPSENTPPIREEHIRAAQAVKDAIADQRERFRLWDEFQEELDNNKYNQSNKKR